MRDERGTYSVPVSNKQKRRGQNGEWVKNVKIWIDMGGGHRIWEKYRHTSHHFPIEATLSTRKYASGQANPLHLGME